MKIFVTGTDTSVGKTVVSCFLLNLMKKQGKQGIYYKPVSSGGKKSRDLDFVKKHALKVKTYCSYHFSFPASPHYAAEKEKKRIVLKKLDRDWQNLASHAHIVVEGAGGLFPLLCRRPPFFVLDLIKRWELPVVLVARASLGTLNHVLLSVSVLEQEKISLACVILNQGVYKKDGTERDNQKTLQMLLSVPVFYLPQVLFPLPPLPFEKAFWSSLEQVSTKSE